MSFTPDSDIRLLYVPIDSEYKHQLRFSTQAQQEAYFLNNGLYQICNDYTYVKENNTIRTAYNYDSINVGANYVMYKNRNFSDKYIYAFIKKKIYVNDNRTDLEIETDVYQTYMFNVSFKECFVVREHIANDYIGANLVEENLETGEYVFPSGYNFTGSLSDLWIVCGTTYVAFSTGQGNGIDKYGGIYQDIYSGVTYVGCSMTNANTMATLLSFINAQGKDKAVNCLFMLPRSHFDLGNRAWLNDEHLFYISGNLKTQYFEGEKNLSTLSGYTPKNKKLFTYPFNFLYANNQAGQEAKYRYEFFIDNQPYFKIQGNVSPSSTTYLIPTYYKGVTYNYSELMSLSNYPVCNYSNDVFTNWLAQNSTGIGLSLAGGAMSTVVAGATGNAIGVAGGLLAVANELSMIYQHSIQPPQTRGSGAGNINASLGLQDFSLSPCCITADYAKRIDKYFDMFGYKTNMVKTPDIWNRPKWNYVKTIDCNFMGNIPQDDLTTFRNIFNNGCTFWANASEVGNYSLNNHF